MSSKDGNGVEIVETLPKYPPRVRLRERFYGKTVAIVGNAPIEAGKGAEIDAHDEVVRFNNAYNLSADATGMKTTILCLTPSTAWETKNEIEKRVYYFRNLKPLPMVHFVKMPERWRWKSVQDAFAGFPFGYDEATGMLPTMTTGTAFLAWVAETCVNCKVDVYGFDGDAEFLEYLKRDGQHYLKNGNGDIAEFSTRSKAREVCSLMQTDGKRFEEYRVCIPARKGSTGVKDKNIFSATGSEADCLLVKKVREACDVFGRERVVALVDSEEYAGILARQGFGACVPYIDRERDALEDITETLRRWCDFADWRGNVLLLQATSPNLKRETLENMKARAETYFDGTERAFITIARLECKSSAVLLANSDGGVSQVVNIPMTRPRQQIPVAYKFTGAGTLFNARALRRASLFDGLELFPMVETTAEEALDVDTESDLKKIV